ncbi:MAG: hypothetical protein ACEPOZ_04960 [Marinifilaceae bacterium]
MKQITVRNDFIESTEEAYVNKAINYKKKLLVYKDQLGFDDETIAQETALVDEVLDWKEKKDQAQRDAKAMVTGFKNSQKKLTAYIRKRRPEIQALANYTESIGVELGLETTYTSIDTKDLIPDVQLHLEGGYPTIRFKKHGTDGIRIFRRINGKGTFAFLDTCNGTYYRDIRQKANPLEPELREYYVFYTIKGETVGKKSQILQISL